MELQPFDPSDAAMVSPWALAAAEVWAWCSRRESPVPPEVIADWSKPDDVLAYGGWIDGELVAYGELWLDDDEAEVELARLIVSPGWRGRGLGRQLVTELAALARQHQSKVFLRVDPDNATARRCYESAGFERVSAEDEAEWNVGQPMPYVWMRAPSSHPQV